MTLMPIFVSALTAGPEPGRKSSLIRMEPK
jgi:hypothetical protein